MDRLKEILRKSDIFVWPFLAYFIKVLILRPTFPEFLCFISVLAFILLYKLISKHYEYRHKVFIEDTEKGQTRSLIEGFKTDISEIKTRLNGGLFNKR